ncbi:hypothetical protein [Halobaculum marinum]|uniref:Uncharacterized protein n=1 Tax=Halobaculum marinum TaxID=3031996 RepID=A0ABD5X020_9EURY|nr:hypothetical protein [Halobaculum sp. DT55]
MDTADIKGEIALLGATPEELNISRVGMSADVQLTPESFRESLGSGPHYLTADINRVIDTKFPDCTPGTEEKRAKNQQYDVVSLDEIKHQDGPVTVEAWVNVVGVFNTGYIQQKLWIGDRETSEFPLVINQKYDGYLVRDENKYRFENVMPNYNEEKLELQLIGNGYTTISHITTKRGSSKPKWRWMPR